MLSDGTHNTSGHTLKREQRGKEENGNQVTHRGPRIQASRF